MGGLQTFAARHTNGSYAQLVTFAKLRERPRADLQDLLKMLGRGPSLQPFVHRAAFCRANPRSEDHSIADLLEQSALFSLT
jgi:hypothetical protein